MHKKKILFFYILFIVICIFFISFPGWQGDFWLDDRSNITDNTRLQINTLDLNSLLQASLSGPSSRTGRPLSMLSFALNGYFNGYTPFYFKFINTAIHCLNSILLFFLSYKILCLKIFQRQKITKKNITILALFISSIWAVTPIHIANSLYIVQRMNLLSVLFVISGCLTYLHIRTHQEYSLIKQFLWFILFLFLLVLAILSKENGVLLIPLALSIEILLHASRQKKFNILFSRILFFSLFILPLLFLTIFLLKQPEWIFSAYHHRDFTLTERILSQLRILFVYVKQTFVPNIYQLTLLHDDFEKSTSLFSPISTLYSLIGWNLLFLISILVRKTYPWLLFGSIWFFIGHSIESTILPLELMFEHRDYLPSYGLIFAFILGLHQFSIYVKKTQLIYLLLCLYISFLLINSYLVSSIWGNTMMMAEVNAENHPHSTHSQIGIGKIRAIQYQHNREDLQYYKQALQHFQQATKNNSNFIAGLVWTILLKDQQNESYSAEKIILLQRLEQLVPHSTHTISIKKILENGLKTSSPFSENFIREIITSLDSNTKFKGKIKAVILKEYADYLYKKKGITVELIERMSQAIQSYPKSIELKIHFTQYLIASNQLAAAKQIIAHIKEQKNHIIYQQQIQNLKQSLENAQTIPKK